MIPRPIRPRRPAGPPRPTRPRRPAGPRLRGALGLAAAALLAVVPTSLRGQAGWAADLMIDPFPSPYVSDWEANPNIASLTVFNQTGARGTVRLTFTIRDGQGRVLADGRSDPESLPPGPTDYHSPFQLSGSFDYDVDIQDVIVRTGRLPEGDFTACTAVTGTSGFVLTEACSTFSVLYPDPPMLLSPYDGERITTEDPFFEWTPLQVPPGFPVRFLLQIAEVERGQTAHQALVSSLPHFQEADLVATTQQYPLGALALEPGTRYAWRVQAVGPNGYPASANDGWSEIWTFTHVDATTGVTAVRIRPGADTLLLPGDTTRLEARAFDEYDFELPDTEVAWTSTDPDVARVDSAGLVTGAASGEAEIVATAGEIADTATVLTGGGGSGLRITFYDPETGETPELYGLLESGSYEEVAAALKEALTDGTFELPLPAPGGLTAAGDARHGATDRLAAAPFGARRAGGPHAASSFAAADAAGTGSAVCPDLEWPYYADFDDQRRSFVIGMRPPAETGASVLRCLGVADLAADRPGQKLEMLFSAAFPRQGAAQAALGMKIPFVGLAEGNRLGIHVDYGVLVLNLGRSFEMDAATNLPAGVPEVAAFYPHEFQVAGADGGLTVDRDGGSQVEATGPGALTLYGRVNLSNSPIVGLLDRLGYQEHALTLRGALTYGVEGQSGGTTARSAIGGRLRLQGTLPRRTPRLDAVSRFVNWAQAGVVLDVELASSGDTAASDSTGSSSGTSTTTATVTPSLVHTMELQLPFARFPPLTLNGSAAWSGSEATTVGDTSRTGGTAGSDSTGTPPDSSSGGPDRSTWTVTYQVSSGGDSTLVLWDYLHLSLGAELAYRESTTRTAAEGELALFGTAGFGSSDGATKVRVAYARKSSNCGGPDEPACTTPETTATGQPTPAETKEGEWKLTLERKSVAFGTMFQDLLRLIEELR